jgi:HlyD family secretion protein
VIRAPINGTILEKLAEEGELVTNMNFGGTRGAKNSVVTMADLNDLQVEVDLNEADVAKVKQGQRTEVRLDGNPQHAYSGVVDEVSPQADRQKGTVQAKVRITDPDSTIKTEVNARVTFYGDPPPPGEQKGARVWAPKAAVVRKGDTATVFVVEDGKAAARSVKTGMDAEKGTEILEGLSGSETVILSPLEKIKDGQRVVAAA